MNDKNLSQNSIPNTQTSSLVETLDRMMTATYGAIWTGAPKTPQQMRDRLSTWGHVVSGLDSDVVKRAIWQIPSKYDRPPTPARFLGLYESLSAGKTIDELTPGPACGVSGCREPAVVEIGSVQRCARHYTDEVDRSGRSADRVDFAGRLQVERERMREMGREAYVAQSCDRMREVIAGMAAPSSRDSGPQLRDQMSDEEFFAQNPGWKVYKRGEADLSEALLSRKRERQGNGKA